MSDFDVVFLILAGYYLSLSWLLNWFPRPTVKLKFVAQCDDELYEGFDGRRNGFLGCGGFSISEDREHLRIQGENGYALVEMQHDQRSGDPRYSAGLFDGVSRGLKSYGAVALANYAGILFYSSARINNEGEDWVYYSNRPKSDVGRSYEENLASNVTEQTSFQNSKRSILPWRRRELSFRSPKAKGELLLKKSYRKEGGDDIDLVRRQLSSDEGASLGWYRADQETNTNWASVTKFGDDSFAVGTWEQKELTSWDGHLKIQMEEGNFDFLHSAMSFDNIWDEITTVCTLTEQKENVFHPWKIRFNVLHGLSQGMKNKISIVVVGSASLNLAEYASKTEEHVEVKLLLTVSDILVESRSMLCLSFSLLELIDRQEAGAVVQSPLMSLMSPSASGEICATEKDESAKEAFREEGGSEEMSSASSEEGEYAYFFESDSLDENVERKSYKAKEHGIHEIISEELKDETSENVMGNSYSLIFKQLIDKACKAKREELIKKFDGLCVVIRNVVGSKVDKVIVFDYTAKLRELGTNYRKFVGLMTDEKEDSDEVSVRVINEHLRIDGKYVHRGERHSTSVLTELVLVPLAGKMKVRKLSNIGFLVSIRFPKPRVKMKLGKMRHKKLGSMIPCGQGILRGRDCCNYKFIIMQAEVERIKPHQHESYTSAKQT